MLNESESVSFVGSIDLVRSVEFYVDTLGFRQISEDEYALVLDLNGHTLRVAKVNEISPAPYTVLGWNVADIDETVQYLSERGVIFQFYEGMQQNGLGVWTSPSGAMVAWFKDPDGNNLSVTEIM